MPEPTPEQQRQWNLMRHYEYADGDPALMHRIDLGVVAVANASEEILRQRYGWHDLPLRTVVGAVIKDLADDLVTSQAALDVLRERASHAARGYTAEHDDGHIEEMARAAACYAMPEPFREMIRTTLAPKPRYWPWAYRFWKPKPDNRRQELVVAAALLLAEIERIDRAGRAPAVLPVASGE